MSDNKMRMAKLSYKTKQLIDLLLPAIFGFFTSAWATQAIYEIWMKQSLFIPINLWLVGLNIHATTVLNVTCIYLLGYLCYRTHLPGHLRVVRALMFASIGVFFYDFMWSLFKIIFTGSGSVILPLTSFIIVLAFLIITNKQTKILSFNINFVVPALIAYFVSLIILVNSGFFQQFALAEQGLALDPHSWEWLLNKTIALWMWMAFALR